ncbi:hypothetical protein D3C86_1441870 [compost metagenome]
MYQPAVPGLPSAAGFSKNTPIVAAPEPNAAEIRDAIPNPVDAPMTNTFLGPLAISPLDFTYSIWFLMFCAVPSGCEVKQIKPLVLGCIIIMINFLTHVLLRMQNKQILVTIDA